MGREIVLPEVVVAATELGAQVVGVGDGEWVFPVYDGSQGIQVDLSEVPEVEWRAAYQEYLKSVK